jgi:thymidylate kinase
MFKVILEGPDCSGKTTLAEKLLKLNSNYKMFKTDFLSWKKQFGDSVARGISSKVFKEKINNNEPLIFDRCLISNYIYAKVYDSPIAELLYEDISELKKMNILIIILLPPVEELFRRFYSCQHDHPMDPMKLFLIYNEYAKLKIELEKKGYNIL